MKIDDRHQYHIEKAKPCVQMIQPCRGLTKQEVAALPKGFTLIKRGMAK